MSGAEVALTAGAAEVSLILNPPARDTIEGTEVFRDRLVAAFARVTARKWAFRKSDAAWLHERAVVSRWNLCPPHHERGD
jgi:hypothetical protein